MPRRRGSVAITLVLVVPTRDGRGGGEKSDGCHAHATPFGLVAVDVPPKTVAEAVMKVLEDGRQSGEWDFDLGVAPG